MEHLCAFIQDTQTQVRVSVRGYVTF